MSSPDITKYNVAVSLIEVQGSTESGLARENYCCVQKKKKEIVIFSFARSEKSVYNASSRTSLHCDQGNFMGAETSIVCSCTLVSVCFLYTAVSLILFPSSMSFMLELILTAVHTATQNVSTWHGTDNPILMRESRECSRMDYVYTSAVYLKHISQTLYMKKKIHSEESNKGEYYA